MGATGEARSTEREAAQPLPSTVRANLCGRLRPRCRRHRHGRVSIGCGGCTPVAAVRGVCKQLVAPGALHTKWTQIALDSDIQLTKTLASFFLSTRIVCFTGPPLPHSAPRSEFPLPFYKEAANALCKLKEVIPDFDIRNSALKVLIEHLSPKLPKQLEHFNKPAEKPSWKLILADFLDARRASFMWRFARGCLPIRKRAFVTAQAGLNKNCPFCNAKETPEHIFYECLIPAALIERTKNLFKLPGVPYQTVRFLNPLPKEGVNQFALLMTECSYQVWLARCKATYTDKQPGLHEVLAKIRKELWFHLERERRHLGTLQFSQTWCRPMIIFSQQQGKIVVEF